MDKLGYVLLLVGAAGMESEVVAVPIAMLFMGLSMIRHAAHKEDVTES